MNNKHMKVFISTPMHGRTVEEIKERMRFIFELAQKRFSYELELIDTVVEGEICDIPDAFEPRLWYLGRSISKMCEAGLVIFDSDWKTARGCQIEYAICNQYHMPYYILDDSEVDI